MIIAQLKGGLGNQLFQYSAAKALAITRKTLLKLDVSEYKGDDLRNFELKRLKVECPLANENEISLLKASTSPQRIFQRLLPYPIKKFYKQPFFHFDKHFFRLSDNVYLQGYFQSEKYFSKFKSQLITELDCSHLVSEKVKDFASQLSKSDSIAIHLRRGDYQTEEANNVHGVLSLDYYQSAISYLKKEVADPEFFTFSDSPETASELGLIDCVLVSGIISFNHFEDLYLMSHCKHNIIANSSFSWWSAWLNKNPDKIVIAPKDWFKNGPKDTYDLIPDGWVRL